MALAARSVAGKTPISATTEHDTTTDPTEIQMADNGDSRS
jgi:hypothetical protein